MSKLKRTKSETKLLVGIGVLILLIDILLMKYWISNIEPNPFISIGVESYRLEIFGANILVGIIVFFIKKRISILFFLNTIVCYWIFSFFWSSWIENHPYSQTIYHFKIENRKFELNIEKNPNLFVIEEIIYESKDSLLSLGMYEKKGDSLKLSCMEGTMYIFKNKLIGFPERPRDRKSVV